MIVLDAVVIYSFFYDLLIALLLIFRCIRDLHADLLSLALGRPWKTMPERSPVKKTLRKKVSGGLLLNVFSKINANLKLQIKPKCGI